jgi:hypothetical protein
LKVRKINAFNTGFKAGTLVWTKKPAILKKKTTKKK